LSLNENSRPLSMQSPRKIISGSGFGNYISGFGINTSFLDHTSPNKRARKKTSDFTALNKERNDLYE
jgi:hypothetical protein